MPDEIFVLSVVAIVMSAVTIMVLAKIIAGFFGSRRDAKHAHASDRGVTTRELEAVMHRAVTEATQPLLARIDELEDRLDDGREEREHLAEPARRLREPGR